MIPINAAFFDERRDLEARIICDWPDDHPTVTGFDTRAVLRNPDIQGKYGGGPKYKEVQWLCAIGALQKDLDRQPIRTMPGAFSLRSIVGGAYFAMTERGRSLQALLRKKHGYPTAAQVGKSSHSKPDRSVPDAVPGADPQADSGAARKQQAHGHSAHSQRSGGSQLPDGRDVGSGDGTGGAGGVADSISSAGGAVTSSDSTTSEPPTSHDTKRKSLSNAGSTKRA